MSGNEDVDESRRRFQAPYTAKHPIPTIAKYQEEKEARKAAAGRDKLDDGDEEDLTQTKTQRAKDGWRSYWYGEKEDEKTNEDKDSKEGANQQQQAVDVGGDGDVGQDEPEVIQDTSEATSMPDPKKSRRKGRREDGAEREVTDPITHLPVRIHDFTQGSLKDVEENPLPFGSTSRTATGVSNKNKSKKQLHDEHEEIQGGLDSMNTLFPPPSYDVIRQELATLNKQGITIGMAGATIIILTALGLERIFRPHLDRSLGSDNHGQWYIGILIWTVLGLFTAGAMWYLIQGVREWMANRIDDTWEDQIWEANLQSRERAAKAHETESVTWLNQLFGSVWPLINPDLFTSLADTLEDVMQASLPRFVQMVSVEDIGQGSEALRILGVKWLPTGAAGRSVGDDGSLKSTDDKKHSNDRTVPGEGEAEDAGPKDADPGGNDDEGERDKKKEEQKTGDGSERADVAEGMEAEEGNFINLEVAFAYRARTSKSFKDRTKDLHFYIAFYLPANLKVPVWVDVKGIIGTCRLRLQLTPDPPFFALCTLTFLGQPKVDISCIPLIKKGLNIMDLPLISNFVQSSVDAAMAEYVAPKSLTLDLKDMLAGDDFKKDTVARGVIVVYIKRGYDFKMGDASIPLISEGSSDPYVSVGWAKFGKPMFSTRVLVSEMEPYWCERATLLVTPEELNVDERLRVQLWDSDRFTADDDLGRIELDLKQIMKSDETNGKTANRTDGFRALKAGEDMPGQLEWSVGYFSKTRLQPCQLEKQTYDSDIRSMKQLEKKVEEKCQRKLREAMIKKGRHSRDAEELDQQKRQEMKEEENAIVISAPPPDDYPSGIFSAQIHQITGLEVDDVRAKADQGTSPDGEEAEGGADLPSAYCTIIINHKQVFKTRTKPKNSKPFYNAGTERFVGDWRNAEVFVAVRDARVDEEDPLLGIVHLPLGEIFKERAQVNGFYPISGGTGFGRIRLSMVWRSVQLQAPPEELGWEYGTLEVKSSITSSDVPEDLKGLKIKLHSNISAVKMHSHHGESGSQEWKTRKGKSLYLPFQKRYASCLAIRFKRNGMLKDKTAAYCIFWLKDIPDDEQRELELPIYKGNFERARVNCLDEPGEKVGSLKVTLKFWSGLSERHSSLANRDPNLKKVMEVLDVARDNLESMQKEREAGIVEDHGHGGPDNEDEDESDPDSDDSSDDDDEDKENEKEAKGDSEPNEDNKSDLIDKARDYKKHFRQEHRRGRGAMQYKLPRTANWASNKAQRVESKFSGIFKRHTREPGVETEV